MKTFDEALNAVLPDTDDWDPNLAYERLARPFVPEIAGSEKLSNFLEFFALLVEEFADDDLLRSGLRSSFHLGLMVGMEMEKPNA